MNLRRGLAAAAGICSVVALGIALESGDPARAVGPPADGNYTFNEAGVSGVTWKIPPAKSHYPAITPSDRPRKNSAPDHAQQSIAAAYC
jgi:hypothetical protein